MKSHSLPTLLLLLLTSLGCASSGLNIVDEGFTAVETSPAQFAVKLESDEIRSEEEAEANLLVHAARWTIDHSGFYFTISDRIRGHESSIALEQAAREDGGTGVPTVTPILTSCRSTGSVLVQAYKPSAENFVINKSGSKVPPPWRKSTPEVGSKSGIPPKYPTTYTSPAPSAATRS